MVVSSIFNLTDGTIGLQQRVLALDDIAFAGFAVGFVVASVMVFHGVRELIVSRGLKINEIMLNSETNSKDRESIFFQL